MVNITFKWSFDNRLWHLLQVTQRMFVTMASLEHSNGILGPLQWSRWLLPFQSTCLEIRMQLHTRTMLLWPLQWHLDHCNGILSLPIQSSCNCYGPCHCNSYNFKCLDLEIRDGGTFSSVFSLLNFLCFGGDCVGQQVKVLQVGDNWAKVRNKVEEGPEAVKLLSRVEQLRLLSKVEKAGLLSAAENSSLSLSSIKKLGLLSKAEDFGVLSTATDRNTPATLFAAALVLLVTGPLVVYPIPEDSTPLVVLQVVVHALTPLGGSTAFAASNFVSSL